MNVETETRSPLAIWRLDSRCEMIERGQILRIELPSPARLGWSTDNWKSIHKVSTVDQGPERHTDELDTTDLPGHTSLLFTIYWVTRQSWEGQDFRVLVNF